MAWENINVSDFGWEGRLRALQNGIVVDISSYTTLQFIFRKPDGTTVAKPASFLTDGSDGILTYTVEAGLIDVVGSWYVQARLSKTGAQLTGEAILFKPEARLD